MAPVYGRIVNPFQSPFVLQGDDLEENLKFTAIKGFKDVLPEEVGYWQFIEAKARSLFSLFGFHEIKTPIIEKTELFSRSIGQETDIVSKEMYSLTDSKGRSLSLRPEATATVVRSYIQNRLYEKNPLRKLYSMGPMFRHERPQKGRLRQFHQIDVELFGDAGPMSDADLIILSMELFRGLGLNDLTLNINTLGCPACRPRFKELLDCYLGDKAERLCSDCRRRAETNPLRIFDCKVPGCKQVMVSAPSIVESVCEECIGHFESLQDHLKGSSISFVLNHHLVRGLDYYTRTTFEIQTTELGAQNAVAGGGRYDGLMEQLGGPSYPAIGFAVGMERVVALLKKVGPPDLDTPVLFIAALGEKAQKRAFGWIQELRREGIPTEMDYAARGLKAQMKQADRIGAPQVLIVGDNELESGKAILRNMSSREQRDVVIENLTESLRKVVFPDE